MASPSIVWTSRECGRVFGMTCSRREDSHLRTCALSDFRSFALSHPVTMSDRRQDALDYHCRGRRGKIEVVPTKPARTQRDLSLAYSPGVAEPCLEIAANPEDVFKYTARGNLVAVISNGTAVLGLGDIGPLAAKPVMEGKGVLFKKFADIDVFDIEIDAEGPGRRASASASCWSRPSAASTSRTSRRRSASTSRRS